MNFYLKIGEFQYEPLKKEEFNELLNKIIIYIVKDKNKFIEISLLIHEFKRLFDSEEIVLYILTKDKYKIRSINTYIKKTYGSFNRFLNFNGIEYQNMICIKN
jgi:hypothetical protein